MNNYKCGPTRNVMVTLPNIGGALYSTTQSVADAHYYMPCSNAAKTRNQVVSDIAIFVLKRDVKLQLTN